MTTDDQEAYILDGVAYGSRMAAARAECFDELKRLGFDAGIAVNILWYAEEIRESLNKLRRIEVLEDRS